MLIYKKATAEELQKFRAEQIKQCNAKKLLDEKQVNVLLDLFLLFANQRTYTIKMKDIESQNTLLRIDEKSSIFCNVLNKMCQNQEPMTFIDFITSYTKCLSRDPDEIYSTINDSEVIDLERLKQLGIELGYTLKDKDYEEIMKCVSKEENIKKEDLVRFFSQRNK